jgi:hypothetical protein
MKCKKHNLDTGLFVYGKPLCSKCCEELMPKKEKEYNEDWREEPESCSTEVKGEPQ